MGGRKSSTTTATSFGYGAKSQTSARIKSKKKRKKSLHPYRSRFERDIAEKFKEEGVSFQYEPFKIEYRLPIKSGVCDTCEGSAVSRLCTYTPDFYLPDSRIWIEAKGKWDSAGRTKTLAILGTSRAINRENFRMLFMYNNWLTKNKKETYLDWCERHNITAAVGTAIPKGWADSPPIL
tara:strand:+ start:36 stop:572 length:537 start_codon:yes stop_codon:yes gene_type:complete